MQLLISVDYFESLNSEHVTLFDLRCLTLSATLCEEHLCDNGRCIPENRVCDLVDHCFDGSDENGCCKLLCYFMYSQLLQVVYPLIFFFFFFFFHLLLLLLLLAYFFFFFFFIIIFFFLLLS